MVTWNQALLRSGLPFEFLIARMLGEAGFATSGEYLYKRIEKDGRETESSVDLRAIYTERTRPQSDEVTEAPPFLELSLLLECKYNESKCYWVFAPASGYRDPPLIQIVDDFSTWSCTTISDLTISPLSEDNAADFAQDPGILNRVTYCLKGTALFEDNSQGTAIERGLNQLRYAAPLQVASFIEQQRLLYEDFLEPVGVCIPILVTSSDIRVLKWDLTIESIKNAKEIDDISYLRPMIVVGTQFGPDLSQHIRKITEPFGDGAWRDWWKLVRTEKRKALRARNVSRGVNHPAHLIQESARFIYVVNHAYLPKLLTQLTNKVSLVHKQLRLILNVDTEGRVSANEG